MPASMKAWITESPESLMTIGWPVASGATDSTASPKAWMLSLEVDRSLGVTSMRAWPSRVTQSPRMLAGRSASVTVSAEMRPRSWSTRRCMAGTKARVAVSRAEAGAAASLPKASDRRFAVACAWPVPLAAARSSRTTAPFNASTLSASLGAGLASAPGSSEGPSRSLRSAMIWSLGSWSAGT